MNISYISLCVDIVLQSEIQRDRKKERENTQGNGIASSSGSCIFNLLMKYQTVYQVSTILYSTRNICGLQFLYSLPRCVYNFNYSYHSGFESFFCLFVCLIRNIFSHVYQSPSFSHYFYLECTWDVLIGTGLWILSVLSKHP